MFVQKSSFEYIFHFSISFLCTLSVCNIYKPKLVHGQLMELLVKLVVYEEINFGELCHQKKYFTYTHILTYIKICLVNKTCKTNQAVRSPDKLSVLNKYTVSFLHWEGPPSTKNKEKLSAHSKYLLTTFLAGLIVCWFWSWTWTYNSKRRGCDDTLDIICKINLDEYKMLD